MADVKVRSERQEWYLGIDGDGMGNTVESALIENDIAKSQEFEKKIKLAFADIEEYIATIQGRTIFCGGDNGFYNFDGDPEKVGEKLRDIYKRHTDHTASCGCGREPVEAHKALVVVKNSGKNALLIWEDSKEAVYEQVKEQQEALEKCEEDIREDSDLELQSSPGLKYRAEQAQKHYSRLRGIGYEHRQALAFVNNLYKLADSYRDIIQRRKQPLRGNDPASSYLRGGEEQWNKFIGNGFKQESTEQAAETPAVPTVGQKIVTEADLGRVAFVGSRFVSVEWLKSGRRERIAFSKFHEMETAQQVATLPQVRTARRAASALREVTKNA